MQSSPRKFVPLIITCSLLATGLVNIVFGQPAVPRSKSAGMSASDAEATKTGSPQQIAITPDRPVDAGDKIDAILTRIALENLPTQFSESKDWGGQQERFDGLKVERDGLKIETRRRRKLVNHGTWKKYSATLRNPTEEFRIQIKNMQESDTGKLAFEIHVAAHLKIKARTSQWAKGVQLYSVSAVGHTQVRMIVAMEMGVQMGISNFPPDLILSPQATNAKIIIDEFRIDRISKIGGEVAQQVSRNVQSKIDEKISRQEEKLVEKINRQLEKNKDDFRLSLADAMKSKWADSLNSAVSPVSP